MRLCIIEDNVDLLANLRLLLGGEQGITVVGAYGSAEEAMIEAPWDKCDTLLVDIDLPGLSGVDLIREIHPAYPMLQIMVHTISDGRETVFAAIKAGAMGYLLKGCSPRDLIDSLRNLEQGGAPMSPKIARRVILEMQNHKDLPDQAGLTPREVDVLQGVSQGRTYKEIAMGMGLSAHTVHSYIKQIYEKLQAANRAEAIHKARTLGVI